jgi:hypothetical protein
MAMRDTDTSPTRKQGDLTSPTRKQGDNPSLARRACGRRCKARATLLWGLILFAAAQVVGGLLLDYCWPQLRFPSAAGVLARLHQQPDPQIVFLGSSRFGSAIFDHEIASLLQRNSDKPDQPYPVLNAAVPVGDPIAEEYVLKQLLRAGAHPRLVVVEVMPENLNRYNEWQSVHVRRQLRWEDIPEHLVEVCWSGQAARLLTGRLFGLHIHREQIRKALVRSVLGERPAPLPAEPPLSHEHIDWKRLLQPPHVEVPPNLAEALRTAPAPHRFLWHYSVGGNCPASLERILALGRQHGFEVLLVASPVTRAHRQEYTAPIEQAFHEYMASVEQRFGCRFIDCRDWLDDSLFVDSHHHCPQGGLYFSRLLTYRVLAPLNPRTQTRLR